MARRVLFSLGWLALGCGGASTGGDEPVSLDESGVESTDAEPPDPTAGSPACGNGLVEGDETCDLGFANRDDGRCTLACRWARCGDGLLGPGETCDPGASSADDPCRADCTVATDIEWLQQVGGSVGGPDEGLEVRVDAQERVYATGWFTDARGPLAWLGAFDADGEPRWEYHWPSGDCEFSRRSRLLAAPEGPVYFAVASCTGETTVAEVHDDGTIGWSTDLSSQASIVGGVGGMDFADAEHIVLSYFEREGEMRLGWLHRADGTLARELAIDDPLLVLRVAPDGTIVGMTRDHLVIYEEDGAVRSRREVRSVTQDLTLDGAEAIVVARDAKEIDSFGPIIERYDDQGNRLGWQRLVHDVVLPDPNIVVGRVEVDEHGTAVVAMGVPAEPGRPASDRDAALLAFDRELQPMWTVRYGGTARSTDQAADVQLLADGDAVVVGVESVALRGTESFVGRIRPPSSGRSAEVPSVGRVAGSRWTAPVPMERSTGPSPETVFVNFLGQRLEPGNDASLGQSQCVEAPLDYPAYVGSRADAERAIEVAGQILSAYAVRFVTERPPTHLPYMLVVVGGLAQDFGLEGAIRGLSCGIDCGDAARRDAVFVFGQSVSGPDELGQVIAHEAAHRWGLEHVDAPLDLMNASASGERTEIVDECRPLSDPDIASCESTHAEFCPEGTSMQRAHAELLAVLGSATAPDDPPQVRILAPSGEAPSIAGEPVVVTVEVDDDHPNFGWSFEVPELAWTRPALSGETSFELVFPPGAYRLQVHADDQAGHQVTATVELWVVEPTEADEPSTSSTESGPSRADAEAEGREGGCRIGAAERARDPGWFWLVLLAVAGRVRSRGLRRWSPVSS